MTSRARLWFASGGLCLTVLLAYANSFQSGFVFDNYTLLLRDIRVQKATAQNVALIFQHTYWWPGGESGLYRPVTTLSYLFNNAILGNHDRPAGYHLLNLLLHAANVLLVFALARRLLGDFRQSLLTASIWAVHPVLTESVTNMVGRADLLAGAATLGGLLIYLKSAEANGLRRAAWLTGLAVSTAIGVFSKESAAAIIAIVALYEITWWNRGRLWALLQAYLAMAPGVLALLWARSRALAQSAPVQFPFVDNPIAWVDFRTGRLTALKVLGKYLGLLIWPAHLSADYSYNQIPLATGSLSDWIAWILVAAVAIAACAMFFRNKTVFFAAGFAFLTLLPASNLVVPIGAIMAERFLYLPAVGFAVVLVLGLYAGARRIRLSAAVPVAAGFLLTAGCLARTIVRNADWKDNATLWAAAVQASPHSFKAHTGLAESMHPDDYDPSSEITDSIIAENERALAILNPLPDVWNTSGVYFTTGAEYAARGFHFAQITPAGQLVPTPEGVARLEKAEALLRRGLAISEAKLHANDGRIPGWLGRTGDPRLNDRRSDARAFLMLSESEQRLGKMEASIGDARRAQALEPAMTDVYTRMHDALAAADQRDKALAVAMKGYLITSESDLQKKMVEDYAYRPEEMKCAISFDGPAPAINFSCPLVKAEACSVSGEAMKIAAKAGPETAARLKNDLATKYGCR